MKTIEIEIGGTGHEITRSKFTKEELDKVKEYCKENDEDIESVLTNDLEEVLEDRGSWYDCDDLGHYMGGNLSSKIYVNGEDGDYDFETKDAQIEYNSKDEWPEFEGGTLVSFITWEKGSMYKCDLELEDDEEFDIKKLKIMARKIETPHSYFEIIEELYYKDEPLNGDTFGDTTGKAFDVEIDE